MKSLALLALLIATPAVAQAPAPDAAEPAVRYTMQPVDGGLMKLDTRTGRLSFCSSRTGGWACELVPEERAAYEDEISRLNERIATLQKAPGVTTPGSGAVANNNVPPGVPDIVAPPSAGKQTAPSPPAANPEPKAGEGAGSTAQAAPDAGDPTGESGVRRHIDQAMDTAEYVFRRFMDMVGRIKGEQEKL